MPPRSRAGDPSSAKEPTNTPGTGTAPPAGRVRTPTLEVRAALLRAARELLEEQGPTGLAVREIANRAGVAGMGVYNRFGSKHGICDALLQEGFTELAAAVTVIPDGADPSASIAVGMTRYRGFALANPQLYRLMFDQPVAEFRPSAQALQAARLAFDRLTEAIRMGVATGHLRPGDPDEIAQQVWAGCHGAVSLELRGVGYISDPDSHYHALIHTLLRGLAATDRVTAPTNIDPTTSGGGDVTPDGQRVKR